MPTAKLDFATHWTCTQEDKNLTTIRGHSKRRNETQSSTSCKGPWSRLIQKEEMRPTPLLHAKAHGRDSFKKKKWDPLLYFMLRPMVETAHSYFNVSLPFNFFFFIFFFFVVINAEAPVQGCVLHSSFFFFIFFFLIINFYSFKFLFFFSCNFDFLFKFQHVVWQYQKFGPCYNVIWQ